MFHFFMMGFMGLLGLIGLNGAIATHRGSKFFTLHSSLIVILPSILLSMMRCLMTLSVSTSRAFSPIS